MVGEFAKGFLATDERLGVFAEVARLACLWDEEIVLMVERLLGDHFFGPRSEIRAGGEEAVVVRADSRLGDGRESFARCKWLRTV